MKTCQIHLDSVKEYQKYMKDKQFKSFVDKYASDYAKYLKDRYLANLNLRDSCLGTFVF